MGNRAVVILKSSPEIGIYLHWAGDLEDIVELVDYAKTAGAREPGNDHLYSFAQLVGAAVSLYGDGGLGVGVGPVRDLDTDNGDNGVYLIDGNWGITHRPDGETT